MGKQLPAARVLVVSILTTYFLAAILSTGQVAAPAGVLILVLVLWFLVYRRRYKRLENRVIITKMYADLVRMLEGLKERIAQEEAQKEAAKEREERARSERERRKATLPTRDPTASKYAEMIENRVREGERIRGGSEGR